MDMMAPTSKPAKLKPTKGVAEEAAPTTRLKAAKKSRTGGVRKRALSTLPKELVQ